MQVRSFCLLTFALPSLAALALPPAVHAASAVHGRRVRAAADCAALRGRSLSRPRQSLLRSPP
jgi:hypothetical protein